jgi:hypothetical protein
MRHALGWGVPRDEVNASLLPVQMCKRRGRRVHFSDDVFGGVLAEVFEVESFKEFNKEILRSATACLELGDEDKQWCDDLLTGLESSSAEARNSALRELDGLILVLSLLPEGSDVVRCALEVARCGNEQQMLAMELYGHVQELASSPHGSEVLQSCLELMKTETARFIPAELLNVAASVATQEHGSEVLCRLVEHLPAQETSSLIKEVLQHCASLCQNEFGNRVVQHILEYGNPSQQKLICQVLADGLPSFARHSIVKGVIEKALNSASADARRVLMGKMLRTPTPARQVPAIHTSTATPSPMSPSPIKHEVAVPMACSRVPMSWSAVKHEIPVAKKSGVRKSSAIAPSKTQVNKAVAASVPKSCPITTLMIRGIPCSYPQEKMLEFLDALGLQGKYNFFYLPRKSHQSNLGYAFVNFIDMAWANVCFVTLNGKSLDPMRSKKVCSVSPARIQGLANLEKHFRHTCVSKSVGRGPVFPETSN